MFKKISLISLVFVIGLSFVFLIFDSISKRLDSPHDYKEPINNLNLPDNNFDNLDFNIDDNDEFRREREEREEKENSITLEEELIIGERLNEFMSLDEVKNLSDEEWLRLEKKIQEINLEDLKKMSIRDFVNLLRVIKN
jgi:hypothetical protein